MASDVEVDPNDPRNLEILEVMRRGRLQKERGFVFRASEIQGELQLLNPVYCTTVLVRANAHSSLTVLLQRRRIGTS